MKLLLFLVLALFGFSCAEEISVKLEFCTFKMKNIVFLIKEN